MNPDGSKASFGGVFKIVLYVFVSVVILSITGVIMLFFGAAFLSVGFRDVGKNSHISAAAKEIGNANPDRPYPTVKAAMTRGTVVLLNNGKTEWPSVAIEIDEKWSYQFSGLAPGKKLEVELFKFKDSGGNFATFGAGHVGDRHEIRVAVPDWNPQRLTCFVEEKAEL